jgi:hypothetical protein
VARHKTIERALPHICFDTVCISDQGESVAAVGVACGIRGEDMRDDAEPVGFELALQPCERVAALRDVGAAVGEERELVRNIGDGRRNRFRPAE